MEDQASSPSCDLAALPPPPPSLPSVRSTGDYTGRQKKINNLQMGEGLGRSQSIRRREILVLDK